MSEITYTCHRSDAPIQIDGDLDKAVWERAPRTERFGALSSGNPGFFDTRAAMLWDERALYVAFWLEERDVYSTGNERTGLTWLDNTAELYIAGPDAYYTLAITPDERRSEMFFIWKDAYRRGGCYDSEEFNLARQKPMVFGGDSAPHHPRGMRWGFFDWAFPGLEIAVRVDGTLNERSDIDRGWRVEIALPWRGIERLCAGPLPPSSTALSIALARCQMVEHRASSFAAIWTPFAMPEGGLHMPEHYGPIQFSETTS